MDPAKVVGDLMFLILIGGVIALPIWLKRRERRRNILADAEGETGDSPESNAGRRDRDSATSQLDVGRQTRQP